MVAMRKKGYWCANAKKVKDFEYKGETYNFIVDFKTKLSKPIKMYIMLV